MINANRRKFVGQIRAEQKATGIAVRKMLAQKLVIYFFLLYYSKQNCHIFMHLIEINQFSNDYDEFEFFEKFNQKFFFNAYEIREGLSCHAQQWEAKLNHASDKNTSPFII